MSLVRDNPNRVTDDQLDTTLRRRGWLSARTNIFGDWSVGDPDIWCAISSTTSVLLKFAEDGGYEASFFFLDTLVLEPQRIGATDYPTLHHFIIELEAYADHPNTDFVVADKTSWARRLLLSDASYRRLTSDPFDEDLDSFLRARGWWSRRASLEVRPGPPLLFDQWRWGAHHDLPGHHLTVACLGEGRFEAEVPREPHALGAHLVEHFPIWTRW